MSLRTKIRILKNCMYSVLTYGSQSWSSTHGQINKLKVTQNKILRSIMNTRLKDKVKISKIKTESKTKDIRYVVKKLKFKYRDHLAREKRKDKWSVIAAE